MLHQIMLWTIFNIFVILLLLFDLGVFHRGNKSVGIRESLIWSVIWIIVALLFNAGVYFWHGTEKALEFLTCYIVERSLSFDNIFVFVLIFSYFRIETQYQYKILFWGILGALVMRAIFILAGVTLIHTFHWLIYVLGAILVIIGIKLALQKEKRVHPERNPVLNLFKKLFPVTEDHHSGKFFIKKDGIIAATSLFVVLIVIETTDIVFAVDSVPAVLAISLDPFIVYTSNVFAILGLRAMYFAIAGLMKIFYYLNYGLSVILVFIGAKMLVSDFYQIHVSTALGFIALVLLFSILLSIIKMKSPQ